MHTKPWALLVSAWLIAFIGVWGGCNDQAGPPPMQYDASRVRRLFRPPEGEVRAVPPHAIHSQGVGPYALGTSLKAILGLLPRGPRVMLMQIDGVLDYSLVRAEADTLLIGVEPPSGVTFLSVLGNETARTESGVGVGTPVEALREALGPELARPERAADPRLLAFVRLPNTRFLLDEPDGQVVAVVVRHDDDAGQAPGQAAGQAPGIAAGQAAGRGMGQAAVANVHAAGKAGQAPGQAATKAAGEPAQTREGSAPASCPVRQVRVLTAADAADAGHAGQAGEARLRQILAAAELAPPAEAPDPAVITTVHRGCFSASEAEALVSGQDQVAVVGGEPGKLRRLAVHAAPGLVYAAPLDMDGDGRSEIVLVSQRVTDEERVTAVQLLRFEAGRLQRVAAEDIYRVSATNAAWVGARLEDVELVIEIRGELEALQLTGLYVHRGDTGPQTVAPLMKTALQVRRGKRSALGPVPGPGPGAPVDAAAAAQSGADQVAAGDQGDPEAVLAAEPARGVGPPAEPARGAGLRAQSQAKTDAEAAPHDQPEADIEARPEADFGAKIDPEAARHAGPQTRPGAAHDADAAVQ